MAFLRVFFSRMTWNRSKSVRAALVFRAASRLAQDEASHLAWTPLFSQNLATAVEPADRGRPGTTYGVRVRLEYDWTCRATPVDGPSMSARLWSTISAMRASFPAYGPTFR